MKRFSFLCIVLLSSLTMGVVQAKSCKTECKTACKPCDCKTHSCFKPRSLVMDGTLNLTSHNYYRYHRNNEMEGEDERNFVTVNGTVFYQESSDSRHLAQYFFPGCKDKIVFREDGFGDANSFHFDVSASKVNNALDENPNQLSLPLFGSILEMRPKRKTVGGILNLFFDGRKFIDWNVWLDVTLIPIHVRHNLNMTELNIGQAAAVESPFKNMISALSNESWCCNRFFECTKKDTHIDDLPIRLGWDFYTEQDYQAGAFFMVTAPTSPKKCAKYIFDPVIGSGGHLGLGGGLRGDYSFWQTDNCSFTIMSEFKYQYFLKKCEKRAFDLCKNGDWSRFLKTATEDSQLQTQPGINCFCRNAEVRPKHQIDWWTGIHGDFGCFDIEFGYNFWYRSKESICLKDCDDACKDRGIWDIVGACEGGQTPIISASCATIDQSVFDPNRAPSDTEFTPITDADLNLDSGATPKAISHKIFLAMNFNNSYNDWPVMMGIGGSYEFGRRDGAVDQWAVWLKGSVSMW